MEWKIKVKLEIICETPKPKQFWKDSPVKQDAC